MEEYTFEVTEEIQESGLVNVESKGMPACCCCCCVEIPTPF